MCICCRPGRIREPTEERFAGQQVTKGMRLNWRFGPPDDDGDTGCDDDGGVHQ